MLLCANTNMAKSTPEQKRQYNKDYYEKHKEARKEANRKKTREWYRANREYGIQQAVQHRKDNREMHRVIEKRALLKLKRTTFNALGGKCSCCGESELDFLAIDHIAEDGKDHRKTFKKGSGAIYRVVRDEGYPRDRYQVLCHNCNYSKYLGKGVCAHKRETLP